MDRKHPNVISDKAKANDLAVRDFACTFLGAVIGSTQRFRFLNRFFISDHNIPRIGPTRKATLASYRIETAADVSEQKIIGIKGFGQSYAAELLEWRAALMRGFVFDPTRGIDSADISDLNRRFAIKRQQLQAGLLAGVERLTEARNEALHQRQQMHPLFY